MENSKNIEACALINANPNPIVFINMDGVNVKEDTKTNMKIKNIFNGMEFFSLFSQYINMNAFLILPIIFAIVAFASQGVYFLMLLLSDDDIEESETLLKTQIIVDNISVVYCVICLAAILCV